MAEVVARMKIGGKNFETMVDLDKALEFRKDKGSIDNVMVIDRVFYDVKKGLQVSGDDLMKAFKTTDIKDIITRIVEKGEVQRPLEYVRMEQEEKIKQIIDFLSKNATDPRGIPYSPEKVKIAIREAGVSIENKPVEKQISRIIEKLQSVIPIKIETKKLKIKVPAVHTGRVYGLIDEYKEREDWLEDGSLLCIVNIPVGLQMDFYDKLNSITHGSSTVEEIR